MNTHCKQRTWIPVIILILTGMLLIGGVSASEFGPWNLQTVASGGKVGEYSSIALDAAGNPAISYYDQTYGDLKYASWDGSKWVITTVDCSKSEPPKKNWWSFWDRRYDRTQDREYISCFHGTEKVGKYSSLAFDNSGKPRISYYDESKGDLKYASWDGSKWVVTTVDGSRDSKGKSWKNWNGDYGRIDDRSRKVGEYTSLALDNTGKPRISYHDDSADELMYAAWDGSRWVITTVDSNGKVGAYSSLALDSSGKPRISYYDESKADLKYASWDGSKWVISTVDGSWDGRGPKRNNYDRDHRWNDYWSKRVGKYSSLALDSTGNPQISYYDESNKDLKYAAFNGTTWIISTIDSTKRVGAFTSLKLDASGNPRISYYDATNRDLKFAAWDSATSRWVTETVDSSKKVGSFSSLVLDSLGNPRISYYDQSNKDLKYAAGTAHTQPPTTPTVTGISPASGPLAGGTVVTITGTGFIGATSVKFGATAGTSLTVNSANKITITSPAGAAGTVDVTVITPTGTSAISSSDQFAYINAPTVIGVSPASGPTTGDTVVTITGTGFTGATAVMFGAAAGTNLTVTDDTHISITSPAGAAGTVDVTIITPDGSSAISPADKFTYYAAPTVTGISPTSGPLAGGTVVTITGTGFTNATAVMFGTNAGTSLTVNSANKITITSPAGAAGNVDVTVITPKGTSATSPADTFSYITVPTITGISPASGPASGGTIVTVTGTGFNGATAVKFGTTAGTTLTVTEDTHITITSPVGTGTVDITVSTPGGTSATSSADQFTYIGAPTVTSIDPPTGVAGTLVSVTNLAGTNFVAGTKPEVWLAKTGEDKIMATNVYVVSPTMITCDIQLAPYKATLPGLWDVYVNNTDGQSGSKTGLFSLTNPAPRIDLIEPDSGINGTVIDVINVTGQNFGFGTNPIIWLSKDGQSDITASDVHIYGTTRLDFRLNIPVKAPAGLWDLHVRSQDGQTTADLGVFTITSGLPEAFTGHWTTDSDWNGWSHTVTYSGSQSYSEYGPTIVNGNGIHGVSLPAGTRTKVVTSTVSKTFTSPSSDTKWSTLTFNGLLSPSDYPAGRSLTINVNSRDVYPQTTAEADTTLNGQQEFTITRTFDRANVVTVTIISKGMFLKDTLLYTTQFNSLTLS